MYPVKLMSIDRKVVFCNRLEALPTPSSGDFTRHSCQCCNERISFSLDRHTFCTKCHGSDCSFDNECDECMPWSSEEMEAYVKLRKSLASKGRGRKSVAKPPSSPGYTA